MQDGYYPESDFLISVCNDEISFDGKFGSTNLDLLISFTTDRITVNRDWAVMLLGQLEIDNSKVRNALTKATFDTDDRVRSEAILQVARRDRELGVSLIARELQLENVMVNVFEAAAIVANESLLETLRPFAKPSGDSYMDGIVRDAIKACETGVSTEPKPVFRSR